MGEVISNPFLAAEAAALYRQGRPDHHARAMAVLVAILGRGSAHRALDIGCGTGQSTSALASISGFTVGLDAALPMAQQGAPGTGGTYVVALGELTPFRDRSFDGRHSLIDVPLA